MAKKTNNATKRTRHNARLLRLSLTIAVIVTLLGLSIIGFLVYREWNGF